MNKKYLISSVSAMVLLLANPVFAEETTSDLSSKPITTPTLDYLGKTSAYEITQGTETDYSFINLVADSEGKITKEYYKINLTGPKGVTWSDTGDHEISLNLPNSETPTTYKYSINPDAPLGTRIDNDLTQEKVDGKLFANIQSGGTLGNTSYGSTYYYGGAIYNTVDNENVNIISDFIGNSLVRTGGGERAYGGAIYNSGIIGNITGDFIGNYAKSESYDASGGAIYNYGSNAKLGNITGDFIGNYAKSESDDAHGGAIYNYSGTISSITGDFIGNYAQGSSSVYGGAIYNSGSKAKIGTINGTFDGNYIQGLIGSSSSSMISGGAIYNYVLSSSGTVEIGDIIGSTIDGKQIAFKDNYAKATGTGGYSQVQGGAIYNYAYDNSSTAKIGDIYGDFIGNYAQGSSDVYGGAIYNSNGTIGAINGDFNHNYAQSESSYAYGGAIDNDSTITGIDGDFIGNYAQGEADIYGGAINNFGTIGNITGDFNNNSAQGEADIYGGAIYNDGTIVNITSNFIGNYAQGSSNIFGGAIYNERGNISAITGDFIGNYAVSESSSAEGGAIYNERENISAITGNFIGNYAQGFGTVLGGAIYNTGTIDNITGDFNNNSAQGEADIYGGAIYNSGTIVNITGNFIGNYLQTSWGMGGAIYNDGTISSITGDFIGNYAKESQGGAIANFYGKIGNILNSKFYGNYITGNADFKGGAIYSNADLTITANAGKTSEFTGNYVIADGVKTENAIYMASDAATLTLNAEDNGKILFNDEIDGVEGYAIALTGDSTGTIDFNNDIRNANISLEKATVNLSDVAYLNNNNALTISSGKFNVTKFGVDDVLTANSIAVNGGVLNIASADVDFETEKMGQLENVTVADEGKINVDNFVILNPGAEEKEVINVAFGDENTQSAIETTVTETLAPIYKYSVAYDAETGEFVFTRGDLVVPDEPEPTPGGDDDDNNNDNKPSVPATPIVRPAGYKAFNPGVFANDVAAMSGLNVQGDVVQNIFDMDTNREYCFGRVWATPFYSDDTISYSGFYDIDSTNYGLIAGVDSKAYGDTNGWTRVYTVFGAYNDGEDKYQGVKVDTKSWLVGLKASVFNGGFYGDALVNYAWHDSDQTTAFGKDSVDTTGYGAALKAGYKHDFNKVNVDTSLMLSWQQVEGKDFTSKSGARFDTDDYSRLSLVPQIKVGYNLDNIRPYALARYNFALSEDGSTTVNNSLALPEIESKDYVEYGLGVETTTSFPHSGYAHVLRHDGGREGWSVTAGYRYNF